MEKLAHTGETFLGAARRCYEQGWTFLVLFFFVFLLSLYVLDVLDLLPNPAASSLTANSNLAAVLPPIEQPEMPVRIEIPVLSLAANVENPIATDIATLDAHLLKGAVRYPSSAKLGEMGNVVIFGHSSYLPIVGNPAYKIFNGIQKLKPGETITLYSSHAVYVYKVKSVTKENAETGAIPLRGVGKQLTLATCNSFGQKSDRFVVVADFVESHPFANP